MKISGFRLDGINSEGEKFRLRFVNPAKRDQIIDMLLPEVPADAKIGAMYVITADTAVVITSLPSSNG